MALASKPAYSSAVRAVDLELHALRRMKAVLTLALASSLVACGVEAGSGDAAVLTDASPRDAGLSDAGAKHDAGERDAGGSFCRPCVSSAECGAGALCLGGVNPRCGLDCSATNQCGGGAACTTYGLGKGPRLGANCPPDDVICGAHTAGEGLSCADTWANYGRTFFASTCIGACHRHDLAYERREDVAAQADAIRFAVETGSMPQGAQLSTVDRTRLLTWLACGAPQ